MAVKTKIKVAVTGAAGNIGYALLFRIASGAVFGPDVQVDLHLLEIPRALPQLEGVVMELEDCAFPLLREVIVTDQPSVAFSGVHWAYLVGAMPRQAGMERSDLLKINGGIFGPQGRAINDHADDAVRVFVVGNPCNTNCLIAMSAAPDVPNDRFFAMTALDENRARSLLARQAHCTVNDIYNLTIWGNHSSTQYPDFHNAQILGQPALTVLDPHWLEQDFIPIVQQRGAAVIKARGASSAASAANAAIDGVRCLLNDTRAGDTFSMALASEGQYGVDPGLIFSFPCRTQGGKLEVVTGVEHGAFGQAKIQASLEELRQERELIRQLGLI